MKAVRLVVILFLALMLLSVLGAVISGAFSPGKGAPEPSTSAEPTPEPSPAPTAEPTPEPTPAPTEAPTELVLHGESAEEILQYASWTQLRYVDATESREYEALRTLQEALPDCRVEWLYEFRGELYNSLDAAEWKLDSTEGLSEALRALPRVTKVDLLDASVTDAEKDALMAANPGVDFLWWVRFGRWTVRSDIEIFSTLQGGTIYEPHYSSEAMAPLFKYCRHMKALDLGHNNLTDLSLLGTMNELQVLILADNPLLRDVSPLAELTELRYLELFSCNRISDFSFLRSLTKLEDVNLCHNYLLTDPSVFDGLENLKVCWLRGVGFTDEQKTAFIEARPDVRVEFSVYLDRQSATDGGWRATEENVAVRTAFYNWSAVLSFDYWEEISYDPKTAIVELRPLMEP